MKHKTSEKGDIGELVVAADLISKGFNVFTPISSTSPFDLLVFKDGKYYRVQVKYRKINDNGSLNVSMTRHSISHSKIKEVENTFVDVMVIYCPCTRECYYIDSKEFNLHISLRVIEPRNKQTKGIRYSKDYLEFPKTT